MPKLKQRREQTSPPLPSLESVLQKLSTSPPATGLPLNEWCFIEPDRPHCPQGEKPYLLEYELAREAEALGITYRSSATWRQVFPGIFPTMPYLAIDAAARAKAIKEALSPRHGAASLFDHTAELRGLSYTFDYALTPEWQNRLETVVEQCPESHDMAGMEQVLHRAVAEFKQNLPEEAYDTSVAYVSLTVRFDYSDDRLKQAFGELLRAVRRVDHMPGLKDELDANLKRLAATRLHRIFGTVEKARSYIYDNGFDNPYQDEGGWSRAGKKVQQLLGARVKSISSRAKTLLERGVPLPQGQE